MNSEALGKVILSAADLGNWDQALSNLSQVEEIANRVLIRLSLFELSLRREKWGPAYQLAKQMTLSMAGIRTYLEPLHTLLIKKSQPEWAAKVASLIEEKSAGY